MAFHKPLLRPGAAKLSHFISHKQVPAIERFMPCSTSIASTHRLVAVLDAFLLHGLQRILWKKSVSLEELLNNTPELKFECRAKTHSEYFPPLLVQQHNDIQP